MSKKVLLVEDERDLVEFMKYALEQEKFEVFVAHNGLEALLMMENKPDVVVLDIMMPKLDGFEVCRQIRETKGIENTPIIFLTAKSSESDELLGLDLGADDYITKPISPKKLIARVKSTLRSYEKRLDLIKNGENVIIKIGPLVINRQRYIVTFNGVELQFPKKEFELLWYLASHPGIVASRDTLLTEVWGSEVYVVVRTVDVHIRKIREKLGDDTDLIETVKGVGYRFKNIT